MFNPDYFGWVLWWEKVEVESVKWIATLKNLLKIWQLQAVESVTNELPGANTN
jgi:hypothetical protein